MMLRLRNKKGSSILEYVALIVLLIAAFLLMEKYVKRSLCDRWRSAGDIFGGGRQYLPNVTSVN
ncbi:hypothetical protein ACFL1I_07845 [Candidatus Omnitrophota bacterium]